MPTMVTDNSTHSPSPNQLLADVRGGEAAALGRLLSLYRNYLTVIADGQLDRKLRARCSPSDVVQETMLEAHRDFAQFRGTQERDFIAWLRRILANNLARQIERHVKAEMRDVRRDVSMAQLRAACDRSASRLAGDWAGGGGLGAMVPDTPSADAQRRERMVILADVMSELADDQRQVLILRNLRELKFREVAQQMGRTEAAVKMLWMRAIKRLRQLYQNRESG